MEEKFLFIFCHHIPLYHFLIMVKVKCMLQKLPASLRNLLQRKFKQFTVICFKLDDTILFQDFVIAGKEFTGSKSSGSMTGLGPWIPEKFR